MQSSAEASLDCKANKRRGQHYWSPIGHRFLSPAVFLRHILEIKPKVVCQVLDGRLIEVITMGELSLKSGRGRFIEVRWPFNTGIISHCFL